MAKFLITWPTGAREVQTRSDADTVDQFVNSYFGSSWENAQDAGVTVELVGDDYELATANDDSPAEDPAEELIEDPAEELTEDPAEELTEDPAD